ncbi:hypothetical protein [Spirosoma arcticum]
MKRDLSIDEQQVYIGDSSTLTLDVSKETNSDKPGAVFKDKNGNPGSLYLVIDNLSDDKTALLEYTYTPGVPTNNPPTPPTLKLTKLDGSALTLVTRLFRRIIPGTIAEVITLPLDEKLPINLSFSIREWDLAGTYIVNAFIADQGVANWASRGDISIDFPTVKLKVMEDSAEVLNVSLREAKREDTPDQLLWMLIRNRTIDFNRYRGFIDKVMCSQEIGEAEAEARNYGQQRIMGFNRTASYNMLKFATEFYLMQEAGLVPSDKLLDLLDIQPDTDIRTNNNVSNVNARPKPNQLPRTSLGTSMRDESRRSARPNLSSVNIIKLRDEYLDELEGEGGRALPYFKIIRQKLSELPLKNITELPGAAYDACYGILQSKLLNPPLLELIWSYWHEEGGLVQTLNALSLRFQNVRRGVDRDPLANLAIDPLRPLSNLLWGYIEDERNRLTINRRNLEYQYEYGISLIGKAVQNIPVAEHRTNFLRGFHELLRATVEFYQQANFTTVIPDGFPILNHLREVHLMLAEGAHNQYGDLPWTARVEMLSQQWLLARPEVREFLGGRIMVPYTEPWMDRVDNMKQLQGWNPTNITHFRDLGVFGEQLLLSIRYGSWNDPTLGGQNAANWAHYWRAEIQRYIHAYKAVTGVDLASDIVDTRISLPANEDRYQQPAQLIERQVAMRQNGQMRPKQVSGPSINAQLPPNAQLIRKEYNG